MLIFRQFSLCCLFVMAAQNAISQRLDHFDLLQLSIAPKADGTLQMTAPRFLSAFNPTGYNNQPSYFSNSKIYLTAQLPKDTTQTEIIALDLGDHTTTLVTRTEASEFSPTLMPNGTRFSCIRQERDGTQKLWSYPIDRSDDGRAVFPNITGVGYHCWLNDTLVAMFIVGENNNPHTLVLAGTKGQKVQKISANIGRSLHRLPDGKLAYVQKATEKTWFIKAYDPKKQSSEILIQTLPDCEDFCVLPDGSFLMGHGSKVYFCGSGTDKQWALVGDLSKYGVKKVTRMAVNNTGDLVIVVQGE